jgi:hypothetical protein
MIKVKYSCGVGGNFEPLNTYLLSFGNQIGLLDRFVHQKSFLYLHLQIKIVIVKISIELANQRL